MKGEGGRCSWIIGILQTHFAPWAQPRPPPRSPPTVVHHFPTVLVRPRPQPPERSVRRHLRRTAVACAAAAALTAQASTWDAPLPPPQLKASPGCRKHSPETRGQLPTYVQADHFEGQTDIRARLKGHVQLRRGDTVIRADEAQYALADDTVTARATSTSTGAAIFTRCPAQTASRCLSGDFTEASYQFLRYPGPWRCPARRVSQPRALDHPPGHLHHLPAR